MKLEGYSNYEIYPETGQIFSYKTNNFIGYKDSNEYYTCWIKNDVGKWNIWRINRLIYTTVYGEIPEGMQVNHINEDKSDNRICNLNLMTPKENVNWGTRNERATKANINHPNKSLPIVALQDRNIKMYFPSTIEAERQGFGRTTISRCAKGIYKKHKGYQWMYLDDYLADWWEQEMDKAV